VFSSGFIDVLRSAANPPLPSTGSAEPAPPPEDLSSEGLGRTLSPAAIAAGFAPGVESPIVGAALSPPGEGRSSWRTGRGASPDCASASAPSTATAAAVAIAGPGRIR
jgi:hypothetical protein